MEHHTTESREPRGVEEAGCKIYSGAPTVSQTTGKKERKKECGGGDGVGWGDGGGGVE